MTQEDKELLLKDVYARIPYGVKGCCEGTTFRTTPSEWYAEYEVGYSINYMIIKSGWRPYLFPISSMTEEQKKEQEAHLTCIKHDMSFSICRYMEWCYKNHLDINGLLSKGLANDATGLNIY